VGGEKSGVGGGRSGGVPVFDDATGHAPGGGGQNWYQALGNGSGVHSHLRWLRFYHQLPYSQGNQS
jgi:hypothetical protein